MTRRRKVWGTDIVHIITEYRAGRATLAELASRYGVTESCISLIVNGKRQAGLGYRFLRDREKERHAARA